MVKLSEVDKGRALGQLEAGSPNAILQDDNARPHRARTINNFLQAHGGKQMQWPAVSPDLNPIEKVMGSVRTRCPRKGDQCNNVGTAGANSKPRMECHTPGQSKKAGKQYEKKMSGCSGSIRWFNSLRVTLKALTCFRNCQSVFLFITLLKYHSVLCI